MNFHVGLVIEGLRAIVATNGFFLVAALHFLVTPEIVQSIVGPSALHATVVLLVDEVSDFFND